MPKSFFALFGVSLTLQLAVVVFATNEFTKSCYAPDGTPNTALDIEPCISIDGADSMCCATNRTSSIDTCERNGLCYNNDFQIYYLDYCTDKNWESPNCLPKTTCTNTTGALLSDATQMTRCGDNSFCCGADNNTDCCNPGLGFNLPDDLVTFNSPNATSTSASVVTVTAKVTVGPDGGSNNDSSTATIGVGVGLGVLAIIGSLGGFFAGLKRGKRVVRTKHDEVAYTDVDTYKPVPPSAPMYEAGGIPVSELNAHENHRL